MLRVYVTDPATATETAYTARLRPDSRFEVGAQVFRGEPDQSSFLLDDPNLELDWEVEFAAGRKVRLTEDASGAEKTLIVGRIKSKEFERGALPQGRQLAVTIEDANTDLTGIPVHNWVRPAETGRVRALAVRTAFLNGSSSTVLNPLGGRYARDSTVIASTYMQDAGNLTMPAETYDATDPINVLAACAEFENKRLGVYINDDGTLALYYAPKTETAQLNCTVGVSDMPGDESDPDYFEPHWIAGPALHTDADELVTGALLVHPTGTTYDRRTAIENVHDRWEEAVYSQLAVADGAVELDSLLDARTLEQPRRQFAIQMPAAQVHLVKAGMRIEVKQAVASAIDATTYFRIVNCRYAWLSPDEDHTYNVIVTLETPVKVGQTWPRPAPSVFRRRVSGAPTSDFEITVVATHPADGLTHMELWAGIAAHNYAYLYTGFDAVAPYDSDPSHVYWHLGTQQAGPFLAGEAITFVLGVAGANAYAHVNGDTLVVPAVAMYGGVSSRVAINGYGSASSTAPLAVESIANRIGVLDDFERVVAGAVFPAGDVDGLSHWGAASIGVAWAIGAGLDGTNVAPYNSSVDGSQGLVFGGDLLVYGRGYHLSLTDAQLQSLPVNAYYGEQYGAVLVAIADGATDSWTLPYPTAYVPGTLQVYVDGVRQTASEDDPLAGEFSLSWTPADGDQISASWRVPSV